MRYIDFSGENGKVFFEALYDGLIGTARGFEAPQETRVLGKVLDKMEAIAHSTKRGELATFSRNEENGTSLVVALEEAEFDLFKAALTHTRWMVRAARDATKAVDWFHAAPTLEPVEPVEEVRDATK